MIIQSREARRKGKNPKNTVKTIRNRFASDGVSAIVHANRTQDSPSADTAHHTLGVGDMGPGWPSPGLVPTSRLTTAVALSASLDSETDSLSRRWPGSRAVRLPMRAQVTSGGGTPRAPQRSAALEPGSSRSTLGGGGDSVGSAASPTATE